MTTYTDQELDALLGEIESDPGQRQSLWLVPAALGLLVAQMAAAELQRAAAPYRARS